MTKHEQFLTCPSVLFLVPRPLPTSGPLKRRDSESQLQSLVARVQCGEWPPVITSLLRDRLKGAGQHEAKEAGQEEELVARSIYRETLFLNMTVSGHLDAGKVNTYGRASSSKQSKQAKLISGIEIEDSPIGKIEAKLENNWILIG